MERSMVAREGGSRTQDSAVPGACAAINLSTPQPALQLRRWMSSTDRQLQENGRTVTRSYWLFLKQGQINLI